MTSILLKSNRLVPVVTILPLPPKDMSIIFFVPYVIVIGFSHLLLLINYNAQRPVHMGKSHILIFSYGTV